MQTFLLAFSLHEVLQLVVNSHCDKLVTSNVCLVCWSVMNVVFSETACEVLFERNADDTSVATIVLESLIKVHTHIF